MSKETKDVPDNYPGKIYQELFNYFMEQHGLPLLQTEMDDVIQIVEKITVHAKAAKDAAKNAK